MPERNTIRENAKLFCWSQDVKMIKRGSVAINGDLWLTIGAIVIVKVILNFRRRAFLGAEM